METYEVERLRRSIAMLAPEAAAGLSREQALQVLGDLNRAQHKLDDLRSELRRLANDTPA
jgi:hypothetical protein